MLSTVPITTPMFDELYEALLRDWNPKLSRDQWQAAFSGRWMRADDEYLGYALTDGGRIVGVLGTLFSQRLVGGRTLRFCNLHGWRVLPECRSQSLTLLRPLLRLKHHTLTDFTASATASAIMKRMGCLPLDSTMILLPRIPYQTGGSHASFCEFSEFQSADDSQIDPADWQIYQDHRGLACHHLLIRREHEYCYVVYSRVDEHKLPYCLVHYVSNKQLFVDEHAAIRQEMTCRTGTKFAVVEERMLAGMQIPLTFRIQGREQLYRPVEVSPREIDTLYSEVVVFKHSPLPGMRQQLRSAVKRCMPTSIRKYLHSDSDSLVAR